MFTTTLWQPGVPGSRVVRHEEPLPRRPFVFLGRARHRNLLQEMQRTSTQPGFFLRYRDDNRPGHRAAY